jgi:hypothetical protein
MITRFQDGFITKSKLNEMVDGINANAEDISDLVLSINSKILIGNISKTVGIGGDFGIGEEKVWTDLDGLLSSG